MLNQLEILEKKIVASFLTVCTVLFVFHPAPDTFLFFMHCFPLLLRGFFLLCPVSPDGFRLKE